MKKFEAGKRYDLGYVTIEVVKRTAKTITYRAIQHAGRFNERIVKESTAKIHNWETREVFFTPTIRLRHINHVTIPAEYK